MITRCHRVFVLLLSCLVLSGCATWSQHGVDVRSQSVRIAVLPVVNAVQIRNLGDIRTLPKDRTSATNEGELVAEEMRRVTTEIGAGIQDGLLRTNRFVVIPAAEVSAALASLAIQPSGRLTTNDVRRLAQQLHADVLLSTQVSGYGKIKRKWFLFLIGSGIVEGVVQGAIVYAAVGSEWAGVAIAAEEILQETLTWGGGVYLFDRIFTPVILESELASAADGTIIWNDTAFARINRAGLKKLSESERGKKEVRLRLTAEVAVADLLTDLNKSAAKNAR
jgi:hypothetical protein